MSSSQSQKKNFQGPTYQAYWILRLVFAIIPLIVGFDKLFGTLFEWSLYVSNSMPLFITNNTREFLAFVGLIEILVGLGVFFKPRIFGWLIAVWSFLAIINLLTLTGMGDLILPNIAIAAGAIALARLATIYDR